MNDWSEGELALLGAARAGLEPKSGDDERIARSLHALGAPLVGGAAGLAPQADPPSRSTPPSKSPTTKASLAAKGPLSLGLGVGAVLGIGIGYLAFAPPHSSEPAQGAVFQEERATEQDLSLEGSDAPAPSPEPAAEELEDEAVAEHLRDQSPEATFHAGWQTPKGRTSSSQDDKARTDLSEELFLLTRARRALSGDQANLALGLLAELAEKHPRGKLLEERQATRILALCATGQAALAGSEHARFVKRNPGSIYLDRLEASCAGSGARASASGPKHQERDN